jgi:hypothetical protein
MCLIVSKNITNVYLQSNSTFVKFFISHLIIHICKVFHRSFCNGNSHVCST